MCIPIDTKMPIQRTVTFPMNYFVGLQSWEGLASIYANKKVHIHAVDENQSELAPQ